MLGYEETLSQENKDKLVVLHELIPNYISKVSKYQIDKGLMYNDLFDKLYEKSLGELIILNKLYKD